LGALANPLEQARDNNLCGQVAHECQIAPDGGHWSRSTAKRVVTIELWLRIERPVLIKDVTITLKAAGTSRSDSHNLAVRTVLEDTREYGICTRPNRQVVCRSPGGDAISGAEDDVSLAKHRADLVGVPDDIQHTRIDLKVWVSLKEMVPQCGGFPPARQSAIELVAGKVVRLEVLWIDDG
jgi:hypothetical protein